ncbi:ferritin-like domain protein [Geotalea daltonii FRC-32]|uniref:Ferritin-like domain protein n=1 Tax=Geotalea daltonii (strain DSM 22248 / JCM 15807 / FRC-32) TaxID=316067 RepID=B9M7Q5_GEODF|nr:ferritin family protein [Geotalea daltonii]ACM22161.1 ferritin-like domain protein [Geotalea daltonii FRC-32]
MGKEYTVQEALKLAIQAEKDSMDFYRRAAAVTKNERAKKVLELLANEEVGHLKSFFDHYKGGEFGDLKSYMESPPNKKNAIFLALEKAIDEDTHEQKALEIALKEEKACIEQYTLLAKDIVDPLVRKIFEQVVKETQNHYEMIEDEYMHVMTMVHRSDQDIYVRE